MLNNRHIQKNINLLITNLCNQKCDYCFADKNINPFNQKGEMPINQYKTIVSRINNSSSKKPVLKLMGGEPTLHSDLKNILAFSLKQKNFVFVFTNGLFNKTTLRIFERLHPYNKQIRFNLNITAHAFMTEKIVEENVNRLRQHYQIVFSLTLNKKGTYYRKILIKLRNIIAGDDRIFFSLGLANPLIKNVPNMNKKELLNQGKLYFYVIKLIKSIFPNSAIESRCGLTRCMFTKNQLMSIFFDKDIVFNGFGCNSKIGDFDISSTGKAYHCYLSDQFKIDLLKKKTIDYFTLKKNLAISQKKLKKKNILLLCNQCEYFGFSKLKCSGICLEEYLITPTAAHSTTRM